MSRFISLVTILFFTSCATLAPPELQTFQKVIDIDRVKKDVLFVRANKWAVDTFVKASSVIEFSDKEAGTLAGKYATELFQGVYVWLYRSNITIDVKDGKSRISFSNPMRKLVSTIFGPAPQSDFSLVQAEGDVLAIRKEWLKLADDFEKSMPLGKFDF